MKSDVSNYYFWWWRFEIFNELIDVLVHVLEDEVELVILLDDLVQIDYVWVVKFNEGPDLVQIDAVLPLGELVLHFLDGYNLPRL